MLLLLLFAAAIALPLTGDWDSAHWNLTLENRDPSTMPDTSLIRGNWARFTKEYEAFFSDRFHLRNELIWMRCELEYRLFSQSASDDVILGKHDSLFDATDHSAEEYMGLPLLDRKDCEVWDQQLLKRRDALQKLGIKYLFAIAPNKQSIYPEEMPDRIPRGKETSTDRLMAVLRQRGHDDCVLDLRSAVLNRRNQGRLFQTIDSHWTDLGGFLAYQCISQKIRQLGVDIPVRAYEPGDFQSLLTTRARLASVMGFEEYPRPVPNVIYIGPPFHFREARVGSLMPTRSARRGDVMTQNDHAASPAHLLVFSDSTILAMYPFFSDSLNQCRYVGDYPKLSEILNYVKQSEPTIVVELRTERTLFRLPEQTGPTPN